MKKSFSVLGLALVLAGTYGYYQVAPVLQGASGYSAKNICSGHFLSGFSGDEIIDQALLGASPLLANITYQINEQEKRVDTSVMGFFNRRAILVDGIGCVLVSAGEDKTPHRVKIEDVQPLDENTLWPQGRAKSKTVKGYSQLLDEAFSEPSQDQLRNTKAVVVVHNGQIVAERYAEGVTESTPLIGWSMTKSVTSLLTGMLVKDRLLDISQPAAVAQWQQAESDPRQAITLDQLLRMSSSLEFNETYDVLSDVSEMLSNQPDTGGFAASKPLIAEPGEIWSYSSGTTNIVSSIIRQTLGGDLQAYYDFTRERLFNPLGIQSAVLEIDANGTFIGSSYGYASARDWARLGQFCLQNGSWQGQQLLPENWITYSTTPTPNNPGNDYGAQFWLNVAPTDSERQRSWPLLPTDAFFFSGYQGQVVAVVPSRDLVVVRLGFTPNGNHGTEQLIAGVIELLP
jgi:CubicO group peptidase (beta-lactamase class C family)